MKISRRLKWYIGVFLLIVFWICGPPILVPLLAPDVVPGYFPLELYIKNSGRLPASEEDYAQWAEDKWNIDLPYNVLYGVSPTELELRDGRLVYKKSGEKCRLIYGGRDFWLDVFNGWKYDRASRKLFQLMQNDASSALPEIVGHDLNQAP